MTKNIFVFGLNEFNREKLQTIRHAEQYRFHNLLDIHDVKDAESYPFKELLNKADTTLSAFEGSVDAIVNFWDFPASVIEPILCERYNLTSASLESVVKTTNKYWSRLEQRKVIPENIPGFCLFHPNDDDALAKIDLRYPFWIKPVQSYSAYLGFRIENAQQFHDCIQIVRENISRYAEPFAELLEYLTLPAELSHLDGSYCIAEEIIDGWQCTVEGYAHRGDIETYGIIDSYRFPNKVSFSRYQYPSSLPNPVQLHINEISKKLIAHLDFDNSAFNIEYFYDQEAEKLWLLEVNSRISQSHSHLFQMVDGRSNHEVEVEVALGNRPTIPDRRGNFNHAAKMFIRRFEDGIVTRTPTARQIQQLESELPGTLIVIPITEGMRLSELLDQDSYSYQLAIIYTAGQNENQLLENYRRCVETLHFEIESVE